MPKFSIRIHGTGCLLKAREKRWFVFRRSVVRLFGFYTTRFVEAESSDEAVANALDMVQSEVNALSISKSCKLSVDEIIEDVNAYDQFAPGGGFSWYEEEKTPS